MEMTHAIKKFDNRSYGEHIAFCGTIVKMHEKTSMNPQKVTCQRCRNLLIDSILKRKQNKLESLSEILPSLNDNDLIHKLNNEMTVLSEEIKHYNSIR
jgi:hypothetical protein